MTSERVQVPNSANINAPPELNFSIPKLEDINPPRKQWNWQCAQLPTDVLLLTAKDPEFLNCYFYLENVFKSYCPELGLVYFGEIGEVKSKEKTKVSLVRCAMGALQVCGSVTVARNAICFLKPKAVICVGFCGGLNQEKAKLGDVVISAKLSTYSSKKVMENGRQINRGIKANVSTNMGKLILNAADGWKSPLKNAEERKVKVHCNGEILSGPELVDFKGRREELLEQHPNAIAIEMEGEGVYAAASDLQVEWVVIKGISDFADGTKKTTGDWQAFACAMAASVVKNISKHPDVLRHWSHYKGVNYGDMQREGTTVKDTNNISITGMLQGVNYGDMQLKGTTAKDTNNISITGYKWLIIAVLVLIIALCIGLLGRSREFQVNNYGSHYGNNYGYCRAVPIPKHPKFSEDLLHKALQNLWGISGQINYKGRTIECRAVRSPLSNSEPWLYDGKAWDIETGISMTRLHFKRSKVAMRRAVVLLIKKLKSEGIIQD